MLKNKFILLFYFVFAIYLFSFVNASLVTNINTQDSYVLDEKMFFNYSLVSDINSSIEFMPYIECPNTPAAPEFKKTVTLTKDTIYKDVYYGLVVKDWFEPQTCSTYIRFVNPIQPIVKTTFKIITDPSFEFNIVLDEKVLIQNEDINIDFTSSVENPTITTTLIFPDKSTQSLTLPTTIEHKQIGTYNIEVTASKEGYKTKTIKEQFAVIKEHAEIGFIDIDGIKKDKKWFEFKLKGPILYALIISIIIIAVILYFIFKKKDKGIGKINEYNYTPPQKTI